MTVATPAWLGATATQAAQAGQINQFLGTHAVTYLYTGVVLESQAVAGSGGIATNGTYLGQHFTPGANQSVGRITLNLSVTGTPPPLTVTMQTTTGAGPSGTILATTLVPPGFVTASSTAVAIPLPCSLTSGTEYWIVLNAVGDASNFYTWFKSNQTSGASTATALPTWTAQTYGFLYAVYDTTAGNTLVHTYADSGARWATFVLNANGTPSQISEYTVAQGSAQYVQSVRALAYSGALLTGVS